MPGMCLNRSSVIGPDGIALADRGRYWGVALAALDLDRPRMVYAGWIQPVSRVSAKTPGTTAVPDTYEELLEYGYWATETRKKPVRAAC